jgi:hypothetical protein
MDDLERQKAEITARMAVETPPLPDVNPNIAESTGTRSNN